MNTKQNHTTFVPRMPNEPLQMRAACPVCYLHTMQDGICVVCDYGCEHPRQLEFEEFIPVMFRHQAD